MKLISIHEVEEYMILAKNVYDNSGKVLLSKETILTDNYIERLKIFGITSVYVIDGLTSDISQETDPDETTRETIKFSNDFLTTVNQQPTDNTNSLRSGTHFTTTNMTGSQGLGDDSQPFLTKMEMSGIESTLAGLTTNMSGGGMNPDALFSTWTTAHHSLPIGSIFREGSIFQNNSGQAPGQPIDFLQAKEAYRLSKESLSASNEIKQHETLRKRAYSLMKELISNQRVLKLMMLIKKHNDGLFMHSISTCVLSIMTGMGAGYDLLILRDLGIAALLHDIGKIFIATELLDKKEELTAEESLQIRKHVHLGHEFLQKYKGISKTAAIVALRHHERIDGSGYPNQLKGNDLNHYVRIVALADTYDTLSTDKAGRNQKPSEEIIEYIRERSNSIFDPEFAAVFLKNIRIFFN